MWRGVYGVRPVCLARLFAGAAGTGSVRRPVAGVADRHAVPDLVFFAGAQGTVDGRSLLATRFPFSIQGFCLRCSSRWWIWAAGQVALALGHALVIALANDLAAYEIGTLFGKRKLSPVIIPKKTVEGSLAGFAAGILVACGLPFDAADLAAIAAVAGGCTLLSVRQGRGATGRSFRLVYQARVKSRISVYPAGARGHYGPVGRGALLRHGLHGVLPLVWDPKERI